MVHTQDCEQITRVNTFLRRSAVHGLRFVLVRFQDLATSIADTPYHERILRIVDWAMSLFRADSVNKNARRASSATSALSPDPYSLEATVAIRGGTTRESMMTAWVFPGDLRRTLPRRWMNSLGVFELASIRAPSTDGKSTPSSRHFIDNTQRTVPSRIASSAA